MVEKKDMIPEEKTIYVLKTRLRCPNCKVFLSDNPLKCPHCKLSFVEIPHEGSQRRLDLYSP